MDHRDSGLDFSNTFYGSELEGTIWHIVAANRCYEIARSRALELRAYLANLSAR